MSKSSAPGKIMAAAIRYAVLTIVAMLFMLPLAYMFVSSLKTDAQIINDMSTLRAFLPSRGMTLENYREVFVTVNFLKFFKNSVCVAVISTVLMTIINAMIGYALGMLNFRGKKLLISLVIALAIIPTESVIINRFLIVQKLGLLNSYAGLALPMVAYPMFIFLYFNHFKGMPRELIEAAVIDGSSYNGIFWKIMLPLSKPILTTVAIMGFIRSWGDLLWPALVTRDETYRTLPLALRGLSTDVYIYWGQIFAFASLMTVPVLIIFIIFQKQFIESLATTGIKG